MSFELDINFNDLNIFNNGDGNPFNSAKVQLRVMEAVDADFNIEVQAGLKGSVEASFPGVKNGNYRQGKNFQPGPTRPSDVCIISRMSRPDH